ncbi:protein MHF1-like [Citrus sinensis]|uniref:Protein MHF1-like n=1 Tax=Citrus sinensis TaxID=2711 RepID=A0ACB8LA09_CITSI|nr:protein MHF1-like [Citrus sinensis]
MEEETNGIDEERKQQHEEDASVTEILRDRFRLSTISIAEAEANQIGMEISKPIIACISDLAFKYTEQLAKDLELFAQHAGRKSVRMEDVILSAHRNEHLAATLRSFRNDLKAKEPRSERKRKKSSTREDITTTNVVQVPDL